MNDAPNLVGRPLFSRVLDDRNWRIHGADEATGEQLMLHPNLP
jgi:hypothetical protein